MIPVISYGCNSLELIEKLKNRSQLHHNEIREQVREIVYQVKANGDQSLFDYTYQFDHVKLTAATVKVTPEEIKEAYLAIDQNLIDINKKASENIRLFHEKQICKTWMDIQNEKIVGQIVNSIEKVGVYVPGGTAVYPSSVLMNIIPAKVAGVKRIIMVSPPMQNGRLNPLTLVTAIEAGVDEIYKIGGAQAIAALAFGTCTIPNVDKIVGPGNIYVALAKKEVFGYVGIDMVAGPSEILIIADKTANPSYVAADLLSQAEHDPLASAILITDNFEVAMQVKKEIEKQIKKLSRAAIIKESLLHYGMIITVANLQEAVHICNIIAPEHLELCIDQPFDLVGCIRNAGAIFLGHYSPEPLGDYFAGPNHVLPTNGTARFFSPLSVDDFIKKTNLIYYSKNALQQVHKDISILAKSEGLTAHANAVDIRYEDS